MNYYLVSGMDSSSDYGFWEVVVQAESREAALLATKNHLDRLSRDDLRYATCKKIEPSDDMVIYSSVEHGRR